MRGCGSRVEGGFYFEVDTVLGDGYSMADVVLCPPKADDLGFHRGPVLISENPCIIAVWVGEKYYPSPLDFIHEAFEKGISRRVPKTFPFEKIKYPAYLLFHHPKARIKNWKEVVEWLKKQGITKIPCPKGCDEHRSGYDMCLGLLNYVFEGQETGGKNRFGQRAVRKIGDVAYPVYQPFSREEMPEVEFEPGFFMIAPLTRIVAVKTADGEAVEKIKKSGYGRKFKIVEE
jgi:hypothetical protein